MTTLMPGDVRCFLCAWAAKVEITLLIIITTLGTLTESKVSKTATDVISFNDLYYSCAFSIHLDLEGQNCADYCAQSLGRPSSGDLGWSFKVDESPELSLSNCAIPGGDVLSPRPQRVLYDVTMNRMVDKWIYAKKENAQISDTYVQRTMKSTFLYNTSALQTIHEPMHLTYATLRQSNRLQQDDQCTYLHLSQPVHSQITSLLPDYFLDIQENHFHGSGVGVMCPSERHPRVAMQFFTDDVEQKIDDTNTYQSWPAITPWIQQHYLRYGYDRNLTITIARSYDAAAEADLVDKFGTDTELVTTTSGEYTDTLFKLEIMEPYTYDTTVAPECSERLDCASCTVNGLCAWCDLSRVPVKLQGHWHSKTGATLEDGSVCGLPPQVCAMMGGFPAVNQCRPRGNF